MPDKRPDTRDTVKVSPLCVMLICISTFMSLNIVTVCSMCETYQGCCQGEYCV
jgi:hypothetical protein